MHHLDEASGLVDAFSRAGGFCHRWLPFRGVEQHAVNCCLQWPTGRVSSNFSIRQLLILLLTVLLVPPSLLLGYSIYSSYQEDIDRIPVAARNLAHEGANSAASVVVNGRYILEELSARPLIRALDRNTCDPILGEIKHFHREFVNLAAINPSGQVVCSVAPSLPGQPLPNFSQREWFGRVAASKTFAIGAPKLGDISKNWIVPLVAPMIDLNKDLIGFLALGLDLGSFRLDFGKRGILGRS